MKSRIMYIEFKGDDLTGPARVGRVTFSQTGKTLHSKSKAFQPFEGDYLAACAARDDGVRARDFRCHGHIGLL